MYIHVEWLTRGEAELLLTLRWGRQETGRLSMLGKEAEQGEIQCMWTRMVTCKLLSDIQVDWNIIVTINVWLLACMIELQWSGEMWFGRSVLNCTSYMYLWLNEGCEVVPTEASFEWQYRSILHGSGAWLGREGCGQHCPLAQSWHQIWWERWHSSHSPRRLPCAQLSDQTEGKETWYWSCSFLAIY